MRRAHRKKGAVAAVASILAIALLWAPAVGAHDDDDDEYYYDDDYGWAGDCCDYDHGCAHGAAIPRFDELRDWGGWRYVPAFGMHLWFPYVELSWRPYYYGHWVRTPYGMTWVSHEPWGYVPHHYGYWVYVDRLGWGWVPGWTYSPAWVTWGVVDGYVGWAPCPPPGYRYPRYHRYRTSIRVSTYGFSGAFGYHDSGLDFGLWIFVADRDFYGRPVYRHAVPTRHTLSLFKSKRVLPVGPRLDPGYVQKISPMKIREVRMDRGTKRIGDRMIEVHEPRGQKELVRFGGEVAKRSYTKAPVVAGSPRVKEDRPAKEVRRAKESPQVKEAPRARAERTPPARDEKRPDGSVKSTEKSTEKPKEKSKADRSKSERPADERPTKRGGK